MRNRRVWPGRDEKILTSWNGLAIAGMARGGASARRPDLAESAARAADFLARALWRDGRLLAVHKDGRSRFPAYLDDYASLAGAARAAADPLARTASRLAVELVDAMLRISRIATRAASSSPRTITSS